MTDLLSKSDFSILDSLLLGDQGHLRNTVYEYKNLIDSCLRYTVGSSLNFFDKLQPSKNKLEFSYLENGSVVTKVSYKCKRNDILNQKVWKMKTSEKTIQIESPWYKPYIGDLPRYDMGKEYVTFIGNFVLFISNFSKKGLYNYKLSSSSTIKSIKLDSNNESYFLAEINQGPRTFLKVYSRKTRKQILNLNCFRPGSSINYSNFCQFTNTSMGKVLFFFNSSTDSFEIYLIKRRSLLCKVPLPVKTKGLRQFFVCGNTVIVNAESSFYVLKLVFEPSPILEFLFEYPNFLERKCWWDRSRVLAENVNFTRLNQNLIVAYSSGKTIGLQVLHTDCHKSSFVRLYDTPGGS